MTWRNMAGELKTLRVKRYCFRHWWWAENIPSRYMCIYRRHFIHTQYSSLFVECFTASHPCRHCSPGQVEDAKKLRNINGWLYHTNDYLSARWGWSRHSWIMVHQARLVWHPNVTNQGELLAVTQETWTLRCSWIKQEHPTITEILKQYHRLQDMQQWHQLGTIIARGWLQTRATRWNWCHNGHDHCTRLTTD